MTFEDGPYVQVSCFCEIVIEDKTGVLSLIRIIDTITHTEKGDSAPDIMPEFQFGFNLVLMLKSGKAKGRYNLRIVPEKPDGSTLDPIVTTAFFEGEEKGHNQIVKLILSFPLEGLYWFDIFIDDKKLTSLPLRVRYNRIVVGTS